MKPLHWYAIALACTCSCGAQAEGSDSISGQVKFQFDSYHRNADGPLAASNALQAGTVAGPINGTKLETELHASGHGLTGIVTLQQQHPHGNATDSNAWVNELYASHDGGAWQLSLGKKIVAWDVGYGFRPNDMVQQEERRALVSSTALGRPMLLAEHFNADTAWSFVWVNPTASTQAIGAQEPALAARLYQRQGSVDWYGFARAGTRTGASVGSALAWVANDSLELHSSLRFLKRVDTKTFNSGNAVLATSNPWQPGSQENVSQLLIGGTWTNESQLSLLAEAWWDGSAPPDSQWLDWAQRNRQLAALTPLAPAAAVAGNLAWQAESLGMANNLRSRNLFMRLSWQHDAWQPALDVLYTPADQGRAVTASLTWQGDRLQVQGGLRVYGGPIGAVMAQLPSQSVAYAGLTWSF